MSHPQFCRLRHRNHLLQKLSPQQLLKYYQWGLARSPAFPWVLTTFFTLPLIIDAAAHPDVLSHAQHHTDQREKEKERAEWWSERHLHILHQPGLISPRGAKHLTFNYASRKQATGMPLTFILSGTVFSPGWFCLSATLLRDSLNLRLDAFFEVPQCSEEALQLSSLK